jgi:hypothetical protein
MRKVKINAWKSKISEDKEIDEDLLIAFNVLLGNKKAEDIPRGLDKARLFNRIRKAFEKAEDSGELVLEEAEYEFLKSTIEKDIPSTWGMSMNLMNAVEDFLNAKSQ